MTREPVDLPDFEHRGLPGGRLVDTGLTDLSVGKESLESLAVSVAAPRLRREGIPVGQTFERPEERLYDLIARSAGGLAHARYNAILRQMVSFADALCATRSSRT